LSERLKHRRLPGFEIIIPDAGIILPRLLKGRVQLPQLARAGRPFEGLIYGSNRRQGSIDGDDVRRQADAASIGEFLAILPTTIVEALTKSNLLREETGEFPRGGVRTRKPAALSRRGFDRSDRLASVCPHRSMPRCYHCLEGIAGSFVSFVPTRDTDKRVAVCRIAKAPC